MTRGFRFVKPLGTTLCVLSDGRRIALPVVPGVLKHPHPSELFRLLENEAVARKYTRLALQKAVWQVLKEFPRDWLVENLGHARLREERRRALRFLLGLAPPPFGRGPTVGTAPPAAVSLTAEGPSGDGPSQEA